MNHLHSGGAGGREQSCGLLDRSAGGGEIFPAAPEDSVRAAVVALQADQQQRAMCRVEPRGQIMQRAIKLGYG